MGGGFILYSGLTPPSTPPRSPKLKPESPRTRANNNLEPVPIEINNRVVHVPEYLQEGLFINNRNLSEQESRLVKRIISEYKALVEDTVAQNNLTPIAPMPIIDRASIRSSRLCDIL